MLILNNKYNNTIHCLKYSEYIKNLKILKLHKYKSRGLENEN